MRHALPAFVLLPLALVALPSSASEPGLQSFTLDNGLRAVVIEDHRAPVVTQMVWYRVGSADDPAGQSGIAHFLEHLMFKATDKLAEGEFNRTVEENGGSTNAFTSVDSTAFVERIAADRLDLVMGMEADRMVNLAPSEASVALRARCGHRGAPAGGGRRPGRRLQGALMAALYPNSPDGRPTIGSEDEIAGLTLESAMAFYRAHYAPNNAILVVAGDVEAERSGSSPSGISDRSRRRRWSPPERPQEPPLGAAARIEVA